MKNIVSVLIVAITACLIANNLQGESSESEQGWAVIKAPGAWESYEIKGRDLKNYDGYAWYRCYIKVPEKWVFFEEGAGKKNLYAQSVTIVTKNIANAHEIYLNGKKIGGVGVMPPNFKQNHNYQRTKVPPKLLQKGHYNVLAIRVFNKNGKGGILDTPPVMAGYFSEAVLNNEWEFRTGDDLKWAIKSTSIKPDYASYERFKNSSSQLDRPDKFITGAKMTPAESMKTMKVDDDLQLDQVLTEPLIAQPTSMSFDERGRLWVVQYRQYPYPAGMKIISRDKYYRAVYDKMSPPPPYHFKGMDRISIHEDTNGDGTYDKHKNFVDDLNIAISAIKGRGGVWVLNSPYLLFYPDKNNDDIPDAAPEVCLEGFGIDDAHSVANGLRWGPDGWLYFIQGSTISSRVKIPGADDKTALYCEGKATWRYHPETKRVELFNESGNNALGLEFDSQGRLLNGLNGGNSRCVHEIQGGYYQKTSVNKYGPLSNPYAFGSLLPLPSANKVLRFSHAVVKYESGELPERFEGNLVAIDPLHRSVYLSKMSRFGSTFQTEDIGEPVSGADIAFRPVMIKTGPDGGIYIADFYEEFIAHGQNYQGQLDPSTGRIYRIRAKGEYKQQPFDLTKKTTDQLVDLLSHKSKWHRQIALRMIGDRKDKSIAPRMHKMLEGNQDQKALDALWALNLIGEFNEQLATKTLAHANPMVRMWTVRLLGDNKKVAPALASQLEKLAASEPNAEVRRQLASSAARLNGEFALPILTGLMKYDEDASDHFIPMLIWYALEKQAKSHREEILKIFMNNQNLFSKKLVTGTILERLMQRYAAAGGRTNLLTCARLLKMSPNAETEKILLKGFEQAFRGRTLGAIPKELAQALSNAGGGSVALKLRLGDEPAIQSALKNIAEKNAKINSRIEMIQILGEMAEQRALPVFLQLIQNTKKQEVQINLLTALQNFDQPKIGMVVVSQFNQFPLEVQEVALTLLASRKNWSKLLLASIEAGAINPKTVSEDTVRKMLLHQDEGIVSIISKHWKDLEGSTNAELQTKITKLNQMLNKKQGNPYTGKLIFNQACGKCHKLFSEGKNVGPDLTAYKRDDSLRMLLHIVNPNAEIREGYETYVVVADGRVATGFLFDSDEKIIVMRGADGQNITIQRDDIEIMQRQKNSTMPEGLLDKMSNEQIRDLFAYLKKSQPIGKE